MKIVLEISDESSKRIKQLLELRRDLADKFEHVKKIPNTGLQLAKINEVIGIGDTEVNQIILNAAYENQEWQKI